MAITTSTLSKWAVGQRRAPGDSGVEEERDPTDDLDVASGEEPESLAWAGQASKDIDDSEAEALMDWLQEAEPDIHDAAMKLANAAADGDAEVADAAAEELRSADQILDEEYPAFTEEQRDAAVEGIREAAGGAEAESVELRVATGKALAGARREAEEEAEGEEEGEGEGEGEEDSEA